MKKHVLIILDGAADLTKVNGKTPLQLACTPNIDFITKRGFTGLLKTLHQDLPRGSIVALLGILGFNPHRYYPHGRASCEAKALDIDLSEGDLAFRANLACIENNILISYNANYIKDFHANKLIDLLNKNLKDKFSNFELYHNSDFRNTLIIRNANVHPLNLICPEPHENMGEEFILSQLVRGLNDESKIIALKINSYILQAAELLKNKRANAIIPWSPSSPLHLPHFSLLKKGKCGIITHMDFLQGIAKASGLDCFKMGNGNWNTDYNGKGIKLIDLLTNDYKFVICHINAPDEASHMGDIKKKIYSIEHIDKHIVSKVIKYFKKNPLEFGSVIITTDHYTNTFLKNESSGRRESHSIDPVPFVVWNNVYKDDVSHFSEVDMLKGKYADPPINHINLLKFIN